MAAQDTPLGDLPTSVHIGKLSDSADEEDDDDFGEADDFQVEDERATINGAYSYMNQHSQKATAAAQATQAKKVKLKASKFDTSSNNNVQQLQQIP